MREGGAESYINICNVVDGESIESQCKKVLGRILKNANDVKLAPVPEKENILKGRLAKNRMMVKYGDEIKKRTKLQKE